MKSNLQDLSWIKLSSNGWQGEKEGKKEIHKSEYLENEKSFLDEVKNNFHSFWRAIIWWKIFFLDTSFKISITVFKKKQYIYTI